MEFAVSRYEQIFMAERLGAAGGGAPAGGGGGGGAMGMSMQIDPAAIISSVATTVEKGKAIENEPAVFFREMTTQFEKHAAKTRKLNARLKRLNTLIKSRRRKLAKITKDARNRNKYIRKWLRSRKRKFQSGPLKGKWKDPLGVQVKKNERKFIGKHGAKPGDLPRKNHYNNEILVWKKEAVRNWTHRARNKLKSFWQRALNIESLRPLMGGTPEGMALMIHANTGYALDPNQLRLVFPRNDKYPYLKKYIDPIIGAKTAWKGRIPKSYRTPIAQDIIGLFTKGWLSGYDPMPNWLLGKKPPEGGAADVTLDLTDIEQVFSKMYKGRPDKLRKVLERRAKILEREGISAGQRKIEKIEVVKTADVKQAEAYAKAQAAQDAAARAAGAPAPAPAPAQPQYPMYDPYQDPYAAQPGYQDAYAAPPGYQDPYAAQQSYYQQPYTQQSYYQQPGSYPQQPQQGYYPSQQYPQYPQYPQY